MWRLKSRSDNIATSLKSDSDSVKGIGVGASVNSLPVESRRRASGKKPLDNWAFRPARRLLVFEFPRLMLDDL